MENDLIKIANLKPGEELSLKPGDILNVLVSTSPVWVCAMCGLTANFLTCLKKYGQPPLKPCFSVSTYHKGKCEICGHETSVTEARDFFYPNFSLLTKLIKKYANKRSKSVSQTTKKNNNQRK